jgi:hypothetical protein
MEVTRVDVNLHTVNTDVFDPRNYDPMFLVQITLQRKLEMWLNVIDQEELLMAGQHQIDSESGCVFEVPIQEVAAPASFIHYLAQRISGFNLDASLCVDLASLIASHAYHIEGHCRGFYVSAHVDLIDVDVNEVAASEIRPILDSEGFTLPRGASETVLKKERLCKKQGGADSSSGSTCVVCLEDFSSSVKLTKLPCSHVFHDKCIFRWLLYSKSCPICRTEVE